jgi:hypothetical protein
MNGPIDDQSYAQLSVMIELVGYKIPYMPESRHRSKFRSTCKSAGAVVTVLLVAIWIGSGWWRCAFYALPTLSTYVDNGKLTMTWKQPWTFKPERVTWSVVERSAYRFDWSFHLWQHTYANGVRQTWVDIPLWSIVLLVGLPTATIWYRDWPRRPAGLCRKCRYDLRGTDHKVCPECGTPIFTSQRRRQRDQHRPGA